MRTVRFSFVTLLLCFCACLSHAQFSSAVERTLTKQLFKPGSVSLLSKQSNLLFKERLANMLQPALMAEVPVRDTLPPGEKPIVFQVQQSSQSNITASAFAIEEQGKLFGVTAAHVMDNISKDPYMYLQTPQGHHAEKITSWRISNVMGTDVAVFEIPPQVCNYVQPLPIATQRAQPSQFASIAGFAFGEPRWFPREEILFSSSHRFLIRNNFQKANRGMCGSPVMIDGKVAGLYVRSFPYKVLFPSLDVSSLAQFPLRSLPPLYVASPIENVLPLIHDLLGQDVQDEGILMKVLGRPVGILHPQEALLSVSLIRNGETKQVIAAEELTDPEHLEQFLELEENDVLRVTIIPQNSDVKSTFYYDINVSSGKVSSPNPLFEAER